MVDDVSRRGVLLAGGAALSGGIAAKLGTRSAAARGDQDGAPAVRWQALVENDDDVTRPVSVRAGGGRVRVGGFSGDDSDDTDPWQYGVDAVRGTDRTGTTAYVEGQFLTEGSAPAADGGRFFLGRYTEDQGSFDATTEPMVLRTTADGEIEWRRTYEPPFDDFRVTDVAPGVDGGPVFVGYSEAWRNPNTWFVAVDTEGSVRWQRRLDEFYATYAWGVQRTAAGSYLVYGGARDGSQRDAERQDGWVAKAGADGEPQWSRLYRQRSVGDASEYHYIEDVAETDDGYLFAGYVSPADEDAEGRAWTLSTDAAGDRLYSALRRPGGDGAGEFVAVVPHGDEFVLAGSTFPVRDEEVGYVWLRGVDASLSSKWELVDPLDQPSALTDAAATDDGGVAVVGNHLNADGWSYPIAAKLGGDPAETATPTPTETEASTPWPTLTPSPTAEPTETPTGTPTPEATASPAPIATADPDGQSTTASADGPGFGVGATLAALGGSALLARLRGDSTDGE
ncbi:PGF-CTERM sorting domain-containing protein [Halosimplex halophilum]|uniref:PGF-CTERM sorting domain-containing protein n=1 Tax=Halosimplex halophilum TaxID=2559572 RepID=UPI0014354A7C|nr:PGF-CTERM sorting domain-containing protein [Halosimplex halophilum]